LIKEEFSGRRDEGDAGLADFLKRKVWLKKTQGEDGKVIWKAGYNR